VRSPTLLAELLRRTRDVALLDSFLALGAGPDLPDQIGRLEAPAADRLGVDDTTLLAVRPDGYVGLAPSGITWRRSSATTASSVGERGLLIDAPVGAIAGCWRTGVLLALRCQI